VCLAHHPRGGLRSDGPAHQAPEPKVRDRQTGEAAKDPNSGESLMTIGVVYFEDGESSLIRVLRRRGVL
jgi:hypothetical protein